MDKKNENRKMKNKKNILKITLVTLALGATGVLFSSQSNNGATNCCAKKACNTECCGEVCSCNGNCNPNGCECGCECCK